MRFSEFLKLRELFNNDSDVKILINNIKHLETNINDPKYSPLGIPKVNFKEVFKTIKDIDKNINDLHNELEVQYKEYQKLALKNSPDCTVNFQICQDQEFIECSVLFSFEVIEFIKTKILLQTDWRFPVLELEPINSEWTELLVGGDPLYIVSNNKKLLKKIQAKFNDVFQRKMCIYYNKDLNNLSFNNYSLPNNQFGFIFSINIFNFIPLSTIKIYVDMISKWLRPGGIALLGYPNCDLPHICNLYESGCWNYNTESLMRDLVKQYNLEVISNDYIYPYHNFITVKKPGKLQSIKRHPLMTKIEKN